MAVGDDEVMVGAMDLAIIGERNRLKEAAETALTPLSKHVRALEVTISGSLRDVVVKLADRLSCVMVAEAPREESGENKKDANAFSEMEVRVGTCTDNVADITAELTCLLERLRV